MPRHTHPRRRHRRAGQPTAQQPPTTPEGLARRLVERGLASPRILGPIRWATEPQNPTDKEPSR